MNERIIEFEVGQSTRLSSNSKVWVEGTKERGVLRPQKVSVARLVPGDRVIFGCRVRTVKSNEKPVKCDAIPDHKEPPCDHQDCTETSAAEPS